MEGERLQYAGQPPRHRAGGCQQAQRCVRHVMRSPCMHWWEHIPLVGSRGINCAPPAGGGHPSQQPAGCRPVLRFLGRCWTPRPCLLIKRGEWTASCMCGTVRSIRSTQAARLRACKSVPLFGAGRPVREPGAVMPQPAALRIFADFALSNQPDLPCCAGGQWAGSVGGQPMQRATRPRENSMAARRRPETSSLRARDAVKHIRQCSSRTQP